MRRHLIRTLPLLSILLAGSLLPAEAQPAAATGCQTCHAAQQSDAPDAG